MRQLLFSILFSLASFLTGFQKNEPATRVVTQIRVTAQTEDRTLERTFTDQQKMSVMLNYLRLLDPHIPSGIEADTFRADHYEIIVSYSDGEQTAYRQIYQDYLQQENGPWERINSAHAARLPLILAVLPDDI